MAAKPIEQLHALNRSCVNCPSPSNYVCLEFGAFICNTCASVHRELGHRIKAIYLSRFSDAEIDFLRQRGNEAVRSEFFKAQPTQEGSDKEALQNFIQNAYVKKLWWIKPQPVFKPDPPQPMSSPTNPNNLPSNIPTQPVSHSISQPVSLQPKLVSDPVPLPTPISQQAYPAPPTQQLPTTQPIHQVASAPYSFAPQSLAPQQPILYPTSPPVVNSPVQQPKSLSHPEVLSQMPNYGGPIPVAYSPQSIAPQPRQIVTPFNYQQTAQPFPPQLQVQPTLARANIPPGVSIPPNAGTLIMTQHGPALVVPGVPIPRGGPQPAVSGPVTFARPNMNVKQTQSIPLETIHIFPMNS